MERIIAYLLDNEDELQTVVQEINSWDGSFESLDIQENDEDFFNTYFESDPMGAVRAASYGDYNYTDDYVRFDGYGNLESLSEWDYKRELRESAGEVAAYLIDNYHNLSLSDWELEELLQEYEEEQEEE